MKRLCLVLLAILLIHVAACDDENKHGYDYLAASYIDTVLAADAVHNGELVQIVHVYPEGCNHFERIESAEHGDSLALSAIYHYYYAGRPCAHGSGLDTTASRLFFSSSGTHFLVYRRSEGARIVQSIFIED